MTRVYCLISELQPRWSILQTQIQNQTSAPVIDSLTSTDKTTLAAQEKAFFTSALVIKSGSVAYTQAENNGGIDRGGCPHMRDNGRGRERDGQRGRQGWTVQYTPDKGQRDVLFMMQTAADAAVAPGPRLK